MMRLLIIALVFFSANVSFAEKAKCTPTPEMQLGNHFTPITREKINVSNGIKMSGKVLSATDCNPIKNAKISHWQANKHGKYTDKLRAYLRTDEFGRFEFLTEWPNTQIPHIHFLVEASGYQTLTTQWVGEDKMKSILLIIVLKEKS